MPKAAAFFNQIRRAKNNQLKHKNYFLTNIKKIKMDILGYIGAKYKNLNYCKSTYY